MDDGPILRMCAAWWLPRLRRERLVGRRRAGSRSAPRRRSDGWICTMRPEASGASLGIARAARRWSRMRAWFLELVGKEPDLNLAEIERRFLAELGVRTTDSSIDRFFKRHKISLKNTSRGRTRSARRGQGQGELQGRPSRA